MRKVCTIKKGDCLSMGSLKTCTREEDISEEIPTISERVQLFWNFLDRVQEEHRELIVFDGGSWVHLYLPFYKYTNTYKLRLCYDGGGFFVEVMLAPNKFKEIESFIKDTHAALEKVADGWDEKASSFSGGTSEFTIPTLLRRCAEQVREALINLRG